MTGWHIVYTRPRAEKAVEARLKGRNLEAWVPLNRCLRRWADRYRMVDLPLFPSYVFVKVEEKAGCLYHRTVSGTPGVMHFLEEQGRPMVLDEETIDKLRKVTALNIPVTPIPGPPPPGSEVLIGEGICKGMKGWVQGSDSEKKILIYTGKLNYILVLNIDSTSLLLV